MSQSPVPSASSFLKRRHRREFCFKNSGRAVIILCLVILSLLLGAILKSGYSAFFQTQVAVSVTAADRKVMQRLNPRYWAAYLLIQDMPQLALLGSQASLQAVASWGSRATLKQWVQAKLVQEQLPPLFLKASSDVDQFYKARIGWMHVAPIYLSSEEYQVVEYLFKNQSFNLTWNWDLFTRGDSQEPELAGIWGALKGSCLVLMVALGLAFPLGVGAGIYLEEFAPRNRLTDWAELHINNLAAVPSILFGLLGWMIFDKFLNFPRPSACLGGATLALMMCPPLIVMTRLALRAVPTLLRDAAYAVGASTVQVVFHQVFPFAFPGILSSTMMVISRVMGESAPLLMVGMVAFIADVPQGISDPATVLPIQIFSWAKNSHPGFLEKTSGAILGLLLLLGVLNAFALLIRSRMERKLAP